MKVTLIGSGNVSESLCIWFNLNRQPVYQIAGRNRRTVSALAKKYKSQTAFVPEQVLPHEGIYILAVNDDEIGNAFKQWYNGKGTWVHTSGSADMKVFGKKTGSFGVLYPVQTLNPASKQSLRFPLPFLIEAGNKKTLAKLSTFLKSLKARYWYADSAKRMQVHLAAVFLNNFIHHLGCIAFRTMKEIKMNEDVLVPLASVTLLNLLDKNRNELQTGPARRKDMNTIKKHLALLRNHPDRKAIYQAITNSIIKTYK